MKKILSFVLSGASLSGAFFAVLPTKSAHASFTCGPYLETYSVRSLNGWAGRGVRCVMRYKDSRVSSSAIAWYGEGYWGNAKYRHIGEGYIGKSAGARDIFGNGENTRGFFDNNLRLSNAGGGRIRVTGAWNEEWVPEADRVVQEYTSTLNRVQNCGGDTNTSLRVADLAGRRSGQGIRCAFDDVWYGEGNWNGVNYAHIGAFTSATGGAASDICEPSRFQTCGNFGADSLKFNPFATGTRVTGAWSEIWSR